MIRGMFACSRCGAAVTAWRGNASRGPLYDADYYDPYHHHLCDPRVVRMAEHETLMPAYARIAAEDVLTERAVLPRVARTIPPKQLPAPLPQRTRPVMPATDGWSVE